jgi:hypothetical protein
MNEVYKTRGRVKFPGKPSGVSEITICSISGEIAERNCPGKNEYFIPGTEPEAKCDGLHGKLSNIKELIIRDKKTMRGKSAPGLFEKNSKEEQTENKTESFLFDD